MKPTQEDNMFVMNRLREKGFTDKELSDIFDIAALSKMDDNKRCKLGPVSYTHLDVYKRHE